MHMGNLALLGKYKSRNILHVLFNNKVHESTGGQPVANQNLNYSLIFKGCGYDIVKTINNLNQFIKEISKSQKKLTALIINIEPGTIKSLPRPKENAKYLKTFGGEIGFSSFRQKKILPYFTLPFCL